MQGGAWGNPAFLPPAVVRAGSPFGGRERTCEVRPVGPRSHDGSVPTPHVGGLRARVCSLRFTHHCGHHGTPEFFQMLVIAQDSKRHASASCRCLWQDDQGFLGAEMEGPLKGVGPVLPAEGTTASVASLRILNLRTGQVKARSLPSCKGNENEGPSNNYPAP